MCNGEYDENVEKYRVKKIDAYEKQVIEMKESFRW